MGAASDAKPQDNWRIFLEDMGDYDGILVHLRSGRHSIFSSVFEPL